MDEFPRKGAQRSLGGEEAEGGLGNQSAASLSLTERRLGGQRRRSLPAGVHRGGPARECSPHDLPFLALTETWITPQNTATPAALSAAYTFSHTPRPSERPA
ncbi:hypothetical protein AAFF_G00410480 [Aldrovandia affinis]|uniref:Uncharacterized protein n=1 Tax=Aldrovandia affinis TaxID=143900 RepID=A0AAD7SC47_9TELE|nr:hypothetical protein AAFF_G00410480 [Aldrovandia affinis]